MKPEEIIRTIHSSDGVYSKAELILLIDNMLQEEFDQFCQSIIRGIEACTPAGSNDTQQS